MVGGRGARERGADDAQDVFSAGCVLAETFLDGRALFDLGTLLSYKQTGELSPATMVRAWDTR